eukprot:jgi/Astpho2/6888/fgenesh1_pm.00106_%23_4_t
MREIYFATGNQNKLKEVVAILEAGESLPFQLRQAEVDLPELQGEAEDIASDKCRLAAKQVGAAVIVEDTSLCFTALGGLPGPYCKWFLKKLGPAGLHKMLAGFEDHSGWAQCIFAYCEGPGAEPKLFVGRTEGIIVAPRVKEGAPVFGWDPCFQPESFNETFGEMDKAVKNTISHRYRALDKLRTFLLGQPSSTESKAAAP